MRRMRRHAFGLALAGALAGGMIAGAPPAFAETQTETIVAEQRTTLALRVTPEAVRSLLPEGWESGAGPSAANLSLIFMDRALGLGPDGERLGTGVNRLLVLAAPARNAATGETRTLIVGGYSADRAGVPGAYNVYGAGSLAMTRNEQADAAGVRTVTEMWRVTADDGGALSVDLTFVRGVPTPSRFELNIYSGAKPDFYRIYRGEQAADVIRNPAAGVDRVQEVKVEAAGGRLAEILTGASPVISVSQAPYYARETFLP